MNLGQKALRQRNRITLLWALIAWSAGALLCLRADEDVLTRWAHEQWQTHSGLPQNSIFSLAQDADGFLWFGTENGLVRYDGVEFKLFNPPLPSSLRHNFASSLLAARDGSLWAGTRTGGLIRYELDNMDHPQVLLVEDRVYALAEGSDGSIWAGTATALVQVLHGEVRRFGLKDGLPFEKISALYSARDGTLWLGFNNGEIASFQQGKFTLAGRAADTRESKVSGLAEDPATGGLWIARDGDGLFRWKDGQFKRFDLLGRDVENLQALCVDQEGSLWVGTQRDGIVRFKNGQAARFGPNEGLGTDYVLTLFQDRQGSIWAGTLFGGLHRLSRGAISTVGRRDGLDSDSVTCVVESAPHQFWIGTRSAGLYKYSQAQFTPVSTPGFAKEIRAMLLMTNGDLWVGGKDGGLLRLRGKQQTLITKEQGLVADDASIIYQSHSGELWIGSQRAGISVVDPTRAQVLRTYTDPAVRTHVRCLTEDREGTFWIGTQYGLVRYRDGLFQAQYLENFPDASIRGLICDEDNTLWIGTRDDGLLRLADGKLFQFDHKTGLVHWRVYQLLKYRSDLWIAGNRGIERVSFTNLAAVANGREPRLRTRVFTERDGLRTVECASDSTPSATVASDGTLWFATRMGLSVLDPRLALTTDEPARVVITQVLLDQRELSPQGFSEVPAGINRVQFSYRTPDLRHGGDILYRYQLEGIDKEWIKAGQGHEAIYYNLDPGKYTFKVAASAPDGTFSEQATTLSFVVAPHFYQTTLFLLTAIFLGAATVGGIYRWSVAGMQRRNQTLQHLVRLRTHELEEEIVQRKRAEEQQVALNLDLESRVVERTSELRTAYNSLQQELRERERIEAELAASEARLRRVVDSGMVGILFWNRDGRILDANDTFLRMVGYTRAELLKGELLWSNLTPPEHHLSDAAAMEEIDRTGVCTPFEKEYIRKNGTRFPVVIGGASTDQIMQEGVCFVLDISERKASEEEVRRLAQSLEARVRERTLELARANEQLAGEVQERKRVAVALSAFSQLGQKLHAARTEKEAATIIAETAKSLIPHELCTIELYGPDNRLYPVISTAAAQPELSARRMASSVSVPIRNGSRVIGVIGVKSSTPDSLNIADANTLQALGDYCGGALDRIHAEEAWRETERRFSAFMANAPALAWMKDSRLCYVFSNPMFQDFLGRTAEQIELKSDSELWPESTAERIRSNDLRVLETAQTLETQETFRRADEETRTLLTLRFPFTTATGERFVAGMAVDITEQKKAEEVLHRLPQSILEAQEQERRRLARELHDSVNQVIASAKFRIQTAENQILRGDSKWQESCSKSKQMLDLVLQQVRRLSHNLRPGELDDLGLLPAARTAFREFEDRTGIVVQFSALGFDERLEPTLESTLYRIIQEALTNIEKHSSATRVDVDLIETPAGVVLEIADNGVGIDAHSEKRIRTGLGLVHMRERVSLVGGTFAIETSPGVGVRIRVQIPSAVYAKARHAGAIHG